MNVWSLDNAIQIPDPNNLGGWGDDSEVFEGSELDSAADKAPAVGGDDFMHTDDFGRLFVGFVMADTLVLMRLLDRKWHAVVEKADWVGRWAFRRGIVVGGNDISDDEAYSGARLEKMKQLAKGRLPSEYYKGLEYDNQQ